MKFIAQIKAVGALGWWELWDSVMMVLGLESGSEGTSGQGEIIAVGGRDALGWRSVGMRVRFREHRGP